MTDPVPPRSGTERSNPCATRSQRYRPRSERTRDDDAPGHCIEPIKRGERLLVVDGDDAGLVNHNTVIPINELDLEIL